MIDQPDYRCARAARCANRVRAGQPAQCECDCHGMAAPYATCSIDGGCGHLHQPDPDAEGPRWEGGPTLTRRGLCETCALYVERALAELPTDYTELHLLLSSGDSGIQEVLVTSSEELKVPIRLSVEALMARMVAEAQAWAEPVAELLLIDWDTDQMSRCRPGFRLQRAAQLLSNALDTLLGLGVQEHRHALDSDWLVRDGVDAAIEFLHLHDLTRSVCGMTRLIHKLPAPCPRCERLTLVRHNGCEHVTCEGCGVRWPEDQYQRLTLVLAEDYQDEAPTHERGVLAAAVEGTTGSAAGGWYPAWPDLPLVDFPASA